MNTSLPTGIIYSRVINVLQIIFLVLTACLLLFVPTFILNILPAEELLADSSVVPEQAVRSFLQGIFVFLAVLFLVSAGGIYFINKGLAKLSETARVWQIILAIFSLLYFPIGTILYGVSLYFMLCDAGTKAVFCKEKEVINK